MVEFTKEDINKIIESLNQILMTLQAYSSANYSYYDLYPPISRIRNLLIEKEKQNEDQLS